MKFKKLMLIFALIFFIGCDKKEENSDKKTTQISDEPVLVQNLDAPFTLNLVGGEMLNISKKDDGLNIDNGKKATLFVFFATWCPPCLVEIEPLNNLQNIYKDNLDIIGVLIQDEKTEEDMKFFIENFHIGYKVSLGSSNNTLADIIGEIEGIPSMVLYDKDGRYNKLYLGVVPQEMLDIDIKKVIN